MNCALHQEGDAPSHSGGEECRGALGPKVKRSILATYILAKVCYDRLHLSHSSNFTTLAFVTVICENRINFADSVLS